MPIYVSVNGWMVKNCLWVRSVGGFTPVVGVTQPGQPIVWIFFFFFLKVWVVLVVWGWGVVGWWWQTSRARWDRGNDWWQLQWAKFNARSVNVAQGVSTLKGDGYPRQSASLVLVLSGGMDRWAEESFSFCHPQEDVWDHFRCLIRLLDKVQSSLVAHVESCVYIH